MHLDTDNGGALIPFFLKQLLGAIRLANKAKSLDDAIAVVISATCSILECDRATLFMVCVLPPCGKTQAVFLAHFPHILGGPHSRSTSYSTGRRC